MFEYICTIGQSFGAAAFINFPNQESYPIALKYGAIDQKSIYSLSSKKHFFPLRTHATPIKIDDWTIKFADHMMEEMKFSNVSSLKLVKSEDFLRWKFDDNPIQRFNWVHIYHKDALCGYIVYHRNKGRLRTAVNIYDWEFSLEVPINVLKKIVLLLLEEGNSVSLWGEYPEATIQMWMDAGLHYQSHEGTRFQIFPFNDEIMQESWQLTRADLDF